MSKLRSNPGTCWLSSFPSSLPWALLLKHFALGISFVYALTSSAKSASKRKHWVGANSLFSFSFQIPGASLFLTHPLPPFPPSFTYWYFSLIHTSEKVVLCCLCWCSMPEKIAVSFYYQTWTSELCCFASTCSIYCPSLDNYKARSKPDAGRSSCSTSTMWALRRASVVRRGKQKSDLWLGRDVWM